MPGIRLVDVRAALAALGLAGLAALAVAIVTHLPTPAPSGPATHAATAGLSKLQALPLQAQSVISSSIAADDRAFAARRTASGWGLSGGGVRADFAAGEPTLRLAGDSTLSLSLTGVPGPTSVTAHGNRVTLARPGIAEWYSAGPLGVEQGFTLAHRPTGATAGGVTLALAVGGSLRPRAAGSAVNFVGSRGNVAARYGGLTAVDATGRHLPGALSVADGRVLITVNDRGARYPITVDPLVEQSVKFVPSDRTLGSGSHIGSSVAISSDGNTVLVGAQIDNQSHGAAWVFVRSGSTWTQQGPKLVPNDGSNAPNSAFGSSVALSGDGNTAVIGGDMDSGTGAAWVYTRSGATWTQQPAKLTGESDPSTISGPALRYRRRHDGNDRRPGRQRRPGGDLAVRQERIDPCPPRGPTARGRSADCPTTSACRGHPWPCPPTGTPPSPAGRMTTPARAAHGRSHGTRVESGARRAAS